MKKQIKNRWLNISKCRFPLPPDRPLDYKEYAIGMRISVNNIEHPDQEEGDTINGEKVMFVDKIYKAKALGDLVIRDGEDKVYLKADKRSQSKLLRGQIIERYRGDGDVDEHYKRTMVKLRHFWYAIEPYLEKLEKAEE